MGLLLQTFSVKNCASPKEYTFFLTCFNRKKKTISVTVALLFNNKSELPGLDIHLPEN